jgi:hypothetical protein
VHVSSFAFAGLRVTAPKDERHPLPHEPKKKDATESRGSVCDKPKRARQQSDTAVEHRPNVIFSSDTPQPHETKNLRYLAPNILSVQHWERLLGGLTYAATPRMDWATLLRRTFEVDILTCTKCSGRLRLLNAVTESTAAEKILKHLGREIDLPTLSRARDPTNYRDDEPPNDEV